MTYFDYKRVRLNRGQDAYAAGMLVGRVSAKVDWSGRLSLRQGIEARYRAVTPDGTVLPAQYRSRHEAAEALYEATQGGPSPEDADVVRPDAYRHRAV